MLYTPWPVGINVYPQPPDEDSWHELTVWAWEHNDTVLKIAGKFSKQTPNRKPTLTIKGPRCKEVYDHVFAVTRRLIGLEALAKARPLPRHFPADADAPLLPEEKLDEEVPLPGGGEGFGASSGDRVPPELEQTGAETAMVVDEEVDWGDVEDEPEDEPVAQALPSVEESGGDDCNGAGDLVPGREEGGANKRAQSHQRKGSRGNGGGGSDGGGGSPRPRPKRGRGMGFRGASFFHAVAFVDA